MSSLQISKLFQDFDKLQARYGDPDSLPIYGAGCTHHPKLMLVFMNPTRSNVSCAKEWAGIRAPWLGTKNIWKLFRALDIIDEKLHSEIVALKSRDWTPKFAEKIFYHIASRGIYVTNFAKCTQVDARPLKNDVFRAYKSLLEKEIDIIKPESIVTFGNQVSQNLLGKTVSVGKYRDGEFETIDICNKKYKVYPTHYPVGLGHRNLPRAVRRIKTIARI